MIVRMMRFIGCLWVALALLATGCAKTDAADSGKTVLRFSFWGNFQDFALWQDITAAFEEKNPDVKIKLEYVTGDYHNKLPLQFISSTAADIVLMDDEQYPAYAVRGYLEDLGPYIQRDRAELRFEDYFPTSLESFNYRGLQAALPWDGMAILIYYNKEMFEKEGIPRPSDDWSWDDFRRIAKQLTKDTDGDGRVDQYGSNLSFGFLPTEPIVWSYGGDPLSPDRTTFALDSPEALAALQMIYDIKWKDHSIAWTGELEGFQDEVQLLTGRVGMVMAGSYMMLTLNTVKGAKPWGVLIPPKGPTGKRFTRVSWDGISLNKATTPAKKEAGWRFIKYLLSSNAQKMIALSGRAVPVNMKDAEAYFPRPETAVREEIVIEAIKKYGRLTPITPKYVELRQATLQEHNAMLFGTLTPAEAVARMKPKADAVLKKEVERWGKHRGK